MRLGIAAVLVLMLSGAAHATMWREEKFCPPDRKVAYCDPDRVQRNREIDEAYRDAIQHHAAPAPVATDPWGDVRAGAAAPGKGKKKRER